MKPRKIETEPNLPTLEPRISALKKKGKTANEDRARQKRLAAILSPLKAALQKRVGK